MAIESKEIIMYIRKGVISAVRTSYRSAISHPYFMGVLLLLIILFSVFPLLYSFSISSFPVILCITVLLVTLLVYGKPNIHDIDKDKNVEISSQQTGNHVEDNVRKKDESFTVLEPHLKTDSEVNERALVDTIGEANKSCSKETKRGDSSVKLHDKDNCTILSSGSFLHNDQKEREIKCGFVKRTEFSVDRQSEPAVDSLKSDADVSDVVAIDSNKLEGPAVPTTKTASSSPFGSDSDRKASSSLHASKVEIFPMLDKLNMKLDSEHSQHTLRTTDNLRNKEETCKESEKKTNTGEAVFLDSPDNQNGVMELGYPEEERNRRLENLIERRRLRKLQRYETEKNLLDLNSYYPPLIPSIQAPRRNLRILLLDSNGNLESSSTPGSAPPILHPRLNTFELLFEQAVETNTLSREDLSHHNFTASSQRHKLSRRQRISRGPLFSHNSNLEKEASKLNPHLAAERTDSEMESQLGQDDNKALGESEMFHDRVKISASSHDSEHVEQDVQSSKPADSTDGKHERSSMDTEADSVNTLISFDGAANSCKEIEDNLLISDTTKARVERVEDSISSSLEANEQARSNNPEETMDEFTHSILVNGAQIADPGYNSSQVAGGTTLSNTSTADEPPISEGTENGIRNSLSSEEHIDFSELASPQRSLAENISSADPDCAAVWSEGDELASGLGDLPVESSDLSVPDENNARLRETTEINEHDSIEAAKSEVSGDIVHPVVITMPKSEAAAQIADSSSSSFENQSVVKDKSLNSKEDGAINKPSTIDELVISQYPQAAAEDPQVSILDLPSNEENSEATSFDGKCRNVLNPPEGSGLSVPQVVEEPSVHIFDIEQEQSIGHKGPEVTGEDDLAEALVNDKSKHTDDLRESPKIPALSEIQPEQEMGFNNDDLREPSKIPALSETQPEQQMGFNNDSSDTQGKSTDEILSKRGGFPGILHNQGKELNGEVHAGISGIEATDHSWVSESETISEFQADIGSKSGQRGSNLDVLEACSIEDLDSVSKQHTEVAVVLPAIESAGTIESAVNQNEPGVCNKNEKLAKSDTEPKSVGGFNSSQLQLGKGFSKPSMSETEIAETLQEITHLKAEEKSIEDINLAPGQLSQATGESPKKQTKVDDGHTEAETSKRNVVDEQSPEENERLLETEHMEVRSAEEIKSHSVDAEKSDKVQ